MAAVPAHVSASSFSSLFADGLDQEGVDHVLRTVRRHLGMDVAFVSHFQPPDRILQHVDADGDAPIRKGQVIPLREGYCHLVVQGRLPELIADTAQMPLALTLPETAALPIGSHLSVPIVLSTGEVYGTLCCFSAHPDSTLGDRDLQMMCAFAEVLAHRVEHQLTEERAARDRTSTVTAALASGAPTPFFQPIYSARDRGLVGFECLSRFACEPALPPDDWFKLAQEVGYGRALESAAIRKALPALRSLGAGPFLAINSSPGHIVSGDLARDLAGVDPGRITIELTEHEIVSDYEELLAALVPLRTAGYRLSIDDAGAGYSSMRHIVRLRPDNIKLDMSLTRGIDTDVARRALARALIAFSQEVGSSITAEGIETAAELETLAALGVDKLQGYLLGRPAPLAAALALGPYWTG